MIILINDCYKQAVIWSVLNSAWEMIQQWLTGVFIFLKRFRSLKSDGWSEFIKRVDLKLQTTIILLRSVTPHAVTTFCTSRNMMTSSWAYELLRWKNNNRPQISAELFWFLFQDYFKQDRVNNYVPPAGGPFLLGSFGSDMKCLLLVEWPFNVQTFRFSVFYIQRPEQHI